MNATRYFAPFLVVLFVIALLFRVEFFFTVLYFLVAIRVLAPLWIGRVLERLKGGRRYVDRAFTGDRVQVELAIRNTSWLPLLWLEVDESLPLNLRTAPFPRQIISLAPHEHWTTGYTLVCQRRGRYAVGPTTLRAGDPLGLSRRELRWGATTDLVVYPQVVALERLGLPTRSPLATLPATAPLFEDTSRIMSVRSYRPGDPLRRVHWPASARSGQLLVKQYQPAIARETLLCLDLSAEGYPARYRHDAVELAIVVAASLANHVIVNEGLSVGLATQAADPLPSAKSGADERPDRFLPPRQERSHLIHLLELLAEVELVTEAARPFTALLRRERLALSWGGTVVAITGRGDADLTEALLGLRRSGLAVALILVGSGRTAEERREWTPPPGVMIYHVERIADLEALGRP